MTKNDTLKLFALLERLHQRKTLPRDAVTVAVWTEVFRPWPYEQVRDAAIRRARANNFMPDAAELAAYLPEQKADTAPSGTADRRYRLWVKLYHEAKRQELARVGLQEWTGGSGAAYMAWRAKVTAAGVDLGAILEATRKVAYGGGGGPV